MYKRQAHTDLRDEYLGEKLSHASVIRRIYDLIGDNKIYQFGIRSGEREEFCFAREHTNLNKFNFTGLSKAIEACRGYPVYFTIDLDVLDPSVFPGTGTPEAGGVTFMELLEAMIVVSELNVVAMDINESVSYTHLTTLNLEENQNNTINIKTNSTQPVVYTSSDETIATVDQSGNIKALKSGTVKITAAIKNKSVTCNAVSYTHLLAGAIIHFI